MPAIWKFCSPAVKPSDLLPSNLAFSAVIGPPQCWWIAFARTGDPNNPTTPPWEPYNVADRPMMVIDETPEMVNHPRGKQLALLGD